LIHKEVGVADRAVAEAVIEPVAVRLGVRVIEGVPVPERVGVPLRDGVRVGDTALREAVALRGGDADALAGATLEVETLCGGNTDVLAVAALEGDEDDAMLAVARADGVDAIVAALEAEIIGDGETPAPGNLRSYWLLTTSTACSNSKVRNLIGCPFPTQVRRLWARSNHCQPHATVRACNSYIRCVGAVVAGHLATTTRWSRGENADMKVCRRRGQRNCVRRRITQNLTIPVFE